MELSQGQIIQKQKMQELSSLFMTHLNLIHVPVKFHEYTCIPYSLGIMAMTRSTIWNLSQGEIIQKPKIAIRGDGKSPNLRQHGPELTSQIPCS